MIDFQNISKSYGEKIIFSDASVRVNTGEKVGIVGPNGIGKSTLFKFITGDEYVDKGDILIPKNSRVAYLKQNLEPNELNVSLVSFTSDAIPELKEIYNQISVLEKEVENSDPSVEKSVIMNKIGELFHRYEHLGGYDLAYQAKSALSGLGFKESRFDEKLSSFSGGWQMRACLARALISNADIMLLDEPSNYLDVPAVEWMKKYLNSYQGTLLVISHDRYLLNTLTAITVEVNNGKLSRYEGNYSYYARERDQRAISLENAKEKQERKINEIEEFVDRFRYKATKAAQVQSRIKMLEKIDRIELQDSLAFSSSMRLPIPPESGHEILRMENVTFSYNGVEKIVIDGNIRIEKGDKVGLLGYNGIGKSTLLKLISGTLTPNNGSVYYGHNVVIGYQPQEFGDVLDPDESVYSTIQKIAKDKSKIRELLGGFGFSGENVNKRCSVLSGGEKIRLLFARIFSIAPNFLILDEPTTHLDIQACINLQNAINKYEGTVCFVSHDIEFLRNSATTILTIENGSIKKYHGDYQYYLQKVAENRVGETTDLEKKSSTDEKKIVRQQKASIRRFFSSQKQKLEKIISSCMTEIDSLETEREFIIQKISDSTNGGINFEDVNKRLSEIEDRLVLVNREWEESSLEIEKVLLEENDAIAKAEL